MAKDKNKGISFGEWEQSIREKRFAPLYLFFGDETFLVNEALGRLVDEVLDESSRNFNLDIVYGGDVDAKQVTALASAFPMLSERRIVVVKEFDKLPNKDGLLAYIERPCTTTSLCLVVPKPDFRLKFFRTFENIGTLVNCALVAEVEIPGWIQKRAAQLGKEIDPDACQLIHARTGGSLYEVFNEVDKVALYVGKEKNISADDVEAVVGMSREFNIFQLQKAIGQRSTKRSAEILNRMLQNGESPLGMIVMLTRFFQKVWLAQELMTKSYQRTEIGATLGVYSSYVEDYLAPARAFGPLELRQIFSALLEADETLKSSATDPALVMMMLLVRMLGTVKAAAVT